MPWAKWRRLRNQLRRYHNIQVEGNWATFNLPKSNRITKFNKKPSIKQSKWQKQLTHLTRVLTEIGHLKISLIQINSSKSPPIHPHLSSKRTRNHNPNTKRSLPLLLLPQRRKWRHQIENCSNNRSHRMKRGGRLKIKKLRGKKVVASNWRVQKMLRSHPQT